MSEFVVVTNAFVDSIRQAFEYHKHLADRATAQLTDDKLHESLDPNTNSIAVNMKHVAGNLVSRWTDFLSSDGEKPWRNRDDEFIDTFSSRDELVDYWDRGWRVLFASLENLTPQDLLRTVFIRGEPHSVPLALSRSLAHTAYHVGQVVQIARVLAQDEWETLTIPRGQSEQFNEQMRYKQA